MPKCSPRNFRRREYGGILKLDHDTVAYWRRHGETDGRHHPRRLTSRRARPSGSICLSSESLATTLAALSDELHARRRREYLARRRPPVPAQGAVVCLGASGKSVGETVTSRSRPPRRAWCMPPVAAEGSHDRRAYHLDAAPGTTPVV